MASKVSRQQTMMEGIAILKVWQLSYDMAAILYSGKAKKPSVASL